MATITADGEYTKLSDGFSFLGNPNGVLGLTFTGATLATTVEIGVYDSDGTTFVPFAEGVITALPTDKLVNIGRDIVINVAGGSPNFSVTPS